MSSQGTSLLPPGGRGSRGADCDLYCEIEGLQVEVRAGDLTQAGLFVQTTSPPDLDSEVELFLRSAAGQVTVTGQVVQVISCGKAAQQNRAPGFGLLFVHLTPEHRLWIEQTLQALRSLQPPPRPRPRSTPQMPTPLRPDRPGGAPAATAEQRRLDRERQATLQRLQEHLASIQQRPPWKVLGVDSNASSEQSRAAYLELTKRYHPHRFARYDSVEISRLATDIFIATKRAYGAMAQAATAPPVRTSRADKRRGQAKTNARKENDKP